MTEITNAPAGENGSEHETEADTESSVVPRTVVSADALRARAAGYAVLVENPAGKYRRRLYLTLASAERAKARATARGQYAAVLLVKFTPVSGGEFL